MCHRHDGIGCPHLTGETICLEFGMRNRLCHYGFHRHADVWDIPWFAQRNAQAGHACGGSLRHFFHHSRHIHPHHPVGHPTLGWVIFIAEWVLAIIGATLNAIDLKKYAKFSMACYLGMGWFVIIGLRPTIISMTVPGFMWLLAGGVAFTIGAVWYLIGKKKRYRHFVFHVFVLLGIILQFVCVWKYLL